MLRGFASRPFTSCSPLASSHVPWANPHPVQPCSADQSLLLLMMMAMHSVLIINREGKVVDMSGGPDRGGPLSNSKGDGGIAKVSSSVGWWGLSTMAMCDTFSGRLALLSLPGLSNVLGASGEPTKVSPGARKTRDRSLPHSLIRAKGPRLSLFTALSIPYVPS